MRADRRFLQWGVFFVGLGAVPLAVQQGWLDRTRLDDVGRLWPLVLIAIGLAVLAGRGPFGTAVRLLPPLAFGLLLGAAFSGGIGAIGCAGADPGAASLPGSSGSFGAQAEVDLSIDCGTATVTTSPGSVWAFSGTGDPGRPPQVSSDSGSLGVSSGRVDFLDFGSARSAWQLSLPTDPALDLSLEMNAGDATVNLSGARLTALSLTANAGSIRLGLSNVVQSDELDATVNAGDVLIGLPSKAMTGSITVNAGHLGLCLPAGVGLQVEAGGALSANNFASRGLVQDGDTWTTPGSPPGAPRISLQVTANAGNIELNPEGGCQ
jgi:hypothetical protein